MRPSGLHGGAEYEMHPEFERFIATMDVLVEGESDPHVIAEGTGQALGRLLGFPEFLEDRFRVPDENGYRQYVVHVHPQGLYSIVSLVWLPGQSTPIHDHRCWCVVGVLEGREQESRYTLHHQDGVEWLVEGKGTYFTPGDVCVLVPPDEDIHRVGNADQSATISMHIYGANIAEVGTSINRRFDLEIREPTNGDGDSRVSWRTHDDHFLTKAAMNRA